MRAAAAPILSVHHHVVIAGTAYPAGVAAATLIGLSLQQWVYVTAIVAALVTSAYTLWHWAREWRGNR